VFKPLARLWIWARNHLRLCIVLTLLVAGLGAGIGVLRWRAGQLPAAERALREGRFAEARDHLNRCLSWSPDDPDVLCLAARLERVEGRYDAAAGYLDRCQARQGTTTALCALEAELLRIQRGDLSQATTVLGLADADNPQTPWILEAVARALMNDLQFRPALAYLDRWLRLQPDCVRALEMSGHMLEKIHRIDDALRRYERALQLDPERWQARLRIVDQLLNNNARVREASPHITILGRQHPEHPDVRLALGLRALDEGKTDQAREWFLRALEADPKHVRSLIQLGKLDLAEGKAAEAEKWLTRAVTLHPYDIQLHFHLSKCCSELKGREKEAKLHWEKYEALKKHNKRLDEMLNTKELANSSDPKVLTEIGGHFLALGQERLGVMWLNKALRGNADYPPAHELLAEYFERTGRPEAAARHRARAGGDKTPGK